MCAYGRLVHGLFQCVARDVDLLQTLQQPLPKRLAQTGQLTNSMQAHAGLCRRTSCAVW